MRSSLVWREMVLPPVVHPDHAHAVLVDLAGLPGQPRLVLEAIAMAGRLRWRIGAGDDLAMRRACHVITTQILGSSALADEPRRVGTDDNAKALAAQLQITRSRDLPLGSPATEQVTRALLGALAQSSAGETLRLQLILGARTRPRTLPADEHGSRRGHPTLRRAAVHRAEQPGFGCVIRIAATAASTERAHSLIARVGGTLTALEAPGVRIGLRSTSVRSIEQAASPFLWPLWLSLTDLVPLTGWPCSRDETATFPGLPPRHPKHVDMQKAHPTSGIVLGDGRRGREQRPVAQPVRDALQHRHILGPTGVGKSTLLANLVLQDIDAGCGGVVIDPKGDLVTDLLARIPESRTADVVVLDPTSPRPVGFNPLTGADPDFAADGILAVFHSLYGDGLGPRSSDILHAACLTLARRGGSSGQPKGKTDASLALIPLLLTNPGFRRSVIGGVVKTDPLGLGAFWSGFDAMSDAERDAATRPLLNKLRPILLRPSLRGIVGQRRPAITIEEIVASNKVLLVRLGKDRIGPEAAALLGSLIVAQVWQAVLGRLALRASQRVPFFLTIDEVQDYLRLPGSLADALAQARGLGVGITAAHQHLGQLGRLQADLEANTATKLFFRLAPTDARAIARDMTSGVLEAEDFTSLPAFTAYARPMVGGTQAPWVSLTTRPLPPAVRNPVALQRSSEARYGQALDEIEQDLLGLAQPAVQQHPGGTTGPSSPAHPAGRRRPTRPTTSPNQSPSDPTPTNTKGGTS